MIIKAIKLIMPWGLVLVLSGCFASAMQQDKQVLDIKTTPEIQFEQLKPDRLNAITTNKELSGFLKKIASAYESRDTEQLRNIFSDDFLYQGMKRDTFISHIKSLELPKGKFSINIIKAKQAGDEIFVVGYAEIGASILAPSLHAIPLNAGSTIVKKNGQFKLRGNQQSYELPLYHKAVVADAIYDANDIEQYKSLIPEGATMPDQPLVRVGITDWQSMEPPQTPYQLAIIAILIEEDNKQGWHIVAMPETDWLAVYAGRPIGFPKFVVDATVEYNGKNTLRAKYNHANSLILKAEFTPDPGAPNLKKTNNAANGWWIQSPGYKTKYQARIDSLDSSEEYGSIKGWLNVDLGKNTPWSNLIKTGTKAPATLLSVTAPFKLSILPRHASAKISSSLPSDIQQFTTTFAQALVKGDMKKVMDSYSTEYDFNGRKHKDLESWISQWIGGMSEFKYVFSDHKFVDENTVQLLGYAEHSFGQTHYANGIHVQRKNGKWKWIGDYKH